VRCRGNFGWPLDKNRGLSATADENPLTTARYLVEKPFANH